MKGRVDAVDVARGVALVGMMFTHIGPGWVGRNPPVGDMMAGGRAAPLFAMLAGVALTLVHRRDPHGTGSVRATVVRAALLVALGLWLGSLDDMPVLIILAFYGLMILVALPFRDLPTRLLVVVATIWAGGSGFVVIAIKVLEPRPEFAQAELSDLQRPLTLLDQLFVHGTYPVLAWFTYVLVGLVVGRLDLGRAVVAWRLVVAGAGLVVATLGTGVVLIRTGLVDDPGGLGWRLLFAQRSAPPEWGDLLQVGQHTSTPLNVISATGSALLVIGLCALLVRVPWSRLVLLPLRAAGTMTLSLYTIHVLWFWRWRIDDGPEVFREGGYGDWLQQVVVLCVAAMLWQRFVGRGPVETVFRLLSVTLWRTGARQTRTRKNAPA